MSLRGANQSKPLAEHANQAVTIETWQLELTGHVQGVGFRPFVYRLAHDLALLGKVCNRLGTVHIVVQGPVTSLCEFRERVISDAPPLSRPMVSSVSAVAAQSFDDFLITESRGGEQARIFVPPDYFMCADCSIEQQDSQDRRYRYPFINCTQCGPRYTLITALPYDRPNTSMAGFPLCEECMAEYTEPANRRFHAEPIACPACGPQLYFESPKARQDSERDDALHAALHELRNGSIVAVKGIGGYHLMCDASNGRTVDKLRRRKHRPHKPLAVMFPLQGDDGLEIVRRSVSLTDNEAATLSGPARPIVLARKTDTCNLADELAPGLNELGVFIPYSPLHQLLLSEFSGPLVATSANLSGEPVMTDNKQVREKLCDIADAFLHHNRPIVRPADDPVYRSIAGQTRPLRLGRGVAPLELELPWRLDEPVIAVGGHMKSTVALAWDNRAVVSPHIGEMDSPRSLQIFEQVVADLQALYGVQARRVICDAHSGYATHRWARRHNTLPVSTVWHHQAHASALVGEMALSGPWLVFTWDGVGLGEDGTMWGGEALLGDAGSWQRIGSLRPFRPPGADRAGREPWRSAAALIWEDGGEWEAVDAGAGLAKQAWDSHLNCPQTSAVGRLFDAAAALVCSVDKVSFEAQGPMMLEALAQNPGEVTQLPLYKDGDILRSDWAPLLPILRNESRTPAARAEDFHTSMAATLVDQANAISRHHDVQRIGLAGGVFQNRLLTEQAITRLQIAGFEVHVNQSLPCNDASLSFGQVAEWAAANGTKESD